MNLAVQALLFGKYSNIQAHAERDESSQSGLVQHELNIWHKLGLFGKIHNIIMHIIAST